VKRRNASQWRRFAQLNREKYWTLCSAVVVPSCEQPNDIPRITFETATGRAVDVINDVHSTKPVSFEAGFEK